MAANTLDVGAVLSPDQIADEIAVKYDAWKRDRHTWEEERLELRNFLYATDTRTTTAGTLPFKNSTTTPKLSQIAQNLKANYMSHMFSDPNWINWEMEEKTEGAFKKRNSIESYVRTKMRLNGSMQIIDALVDDWIQQGVCYCRLNYVNESHIDEAGLTVPGYIGPRLERISPHDIVFNIAATSFENSPKIIRSLLSMGELVKQSKTNPEDTAWTEETLNAMRARRVAIRGSAKEVAKADMDKSRQYIADGFSSITEYYNTDLVEVLEFYGDWYDVDTGEFLENYMITVVDRVHVVRKEPVKNWRGRPYIYYSAWRERPDNLMGMGPLDNLVGMQYKIDKLENLKADVFDQIANPTVVETGDVEFFGVRGAPGQRYVVAEGGTVQHLRPDTTALSADLQIAQTMSLMEELAGAPREAMGMRSPGEKTKFEVQVLDNAANRLFRNKVRKFEMFLEDILNDFLEMARRNLDGADTIRMQDTTFGVDQFIDITKEDITATGKMYARGSMLFEKQANSLQNLNMVFNSQLGQIIAPHMSRKQLARIVEDLLSADQFKLFRDNVGLMEDLESQRLMQAGAEQLEEESMTDGTLNGDESEVPPESV
jgi:hypothetical protein